MTGEFSFNRDTFLEKNNSNKRKFLPKIVATFFYLWLLLFEVIRQYQLHQDQLKEFFSKSGYINRPHRSRLTARNLEATTLLTCDLKTSLEVTLKKWHLSGSFGSKKSDQKLILQAISYLKLDQSCIKVTSQMQSKSYFDLLNN
ncbi:hypothetical protein BpHYR1_045847 [Brachionus plicatilis]|uniref:Uncharacterized protein n=1 Tax=Brachionus plicatilis TaxID=10195 RepID=A0A3M7P8X6_BRAPC|nr:hypothetical protein BpHYR1_045847 [Brachionus plicatilis]